MLEDTLVSMQDMLKHIDTGCPGEKACGGYWSTSADGKSSGLKVPLSSSTEEVLTAYRDRQVKKLLTETPTRTLRNRNKAK